MAIPKTGGPTQRIGLELFSVGNRWAIGPWAKPNNFLVSVLKRSRRTSVQIGNRIWKSVPKLTLDRVLHIEKVVQGFLSSTENFECKVKAEDKPTRFPSQLEMVRTFRATAKTELLEGTLADDPLKDVILSIVDQEAFGSGWGMNEERDTIGRLTGKITEAFTRKATKMIDKANRGQNKLYLPDEAR